MLLLFSSIWVILQNNARIGDNLPEDAWLSLLRLPRATRALEALVLLALFVWHQQRLLRGGEALLTALVWAFVLSAGLGIVVSPSLLLVQLQGIYVYIAPLLVFAWARATSPDARLAGRLVRAFVIYLAIASAVAFGVQLPAIQTRSDLIHGTFSDAHVLGFYLAVGSCAAFTRFLREGGLRWLATATVFFVASLFPSNEKMIFFNVAWCAAALGARLAAHPASRRGWLSVAAAAGLVGWVVTSQVDRIEEWISVGALRDRSPAELGPIQSWVRAAAVLQDSAGSFLVGAGAGNYAGIAAERAVAEDPRAFQNLSAAARFAFVDDRNTSGAVGYLTNTWANLLAEFGTLGFVIFVCAAACLWRRILWWRPSTPFDSRVRDLAVTGLAGTMFQGLITPYSNWSEPVVIYPMVVLAAYCHGAAARDRRPD
jgi:hypothetical protein